jgi:uncharacterized coiled-coil protein SlyX
MPRKHKAFATVQQEIDKKIAQHKNSHSKATKKQRKKLKLAIGRLQAMKRVLAAAWNAKTCPPRK